MDEMGDKTGDEDEMDDDALFEGGTFFNDDGTEVNPDLIPIPPLCLTCKKNDKRGEEYVLCTLTRADQTKDRQFECGEYVPLG
jgi:hypothetical protein